MPQIEIIQPEKRPEPPEFYQNLDGKVLTPSEPKAPPTTQVYHDAKQTKDTVAKTKTVLNWALLIGSIGTFIGFMGALMGWGSIFHSMILAFGFMLAFSILIRVNIKKVFG